MSAMLLAEFADSVRFVEAARRVQRAHYFLLDAFTPFPLEDVHALLPPRRSRIRMVMFVAGIAMAVLAYGLEFYSAVFNYPYDSGGRPFNAWPTFMLVPFATGILIAAVAGFIAFLLETGLPRLHDPLFAVPGFDRASQDSFILAVARPRADDDRRHVLDLLRGAGAFAIREVEA